MSCNKGYFVGGLFVGTIIGGALGILLAQAPAKKHAVRLKTVRRTLLVTLMTRLWNMVKT